MNFTVDEIIEATGAELIKSINSTEKYSISTDSRNIKENQFYLPLKGEKFDGAAFIDSALSNGAKGIFISDEALSNKDCDFVFLVEDTKIAYLELARFYKRKINPVTIAVTGSSGKTTTKEIMFSVVNTAFKSHKSILNHNNEIGLCQTLLSMPEDTRVLVAEMGMRGFGEIKLLSEFAEPDIAIISNVGSAHIGRLGSLENIAKAKCEITSFLDEDGVLIAHDSELVKNANTFKGETIYFSLRSKDLENIELSQSGSSFTYKDYRYQLNIEGEYNIENALAVIEAGLVLGMKEADIAKGLAEYKPIEKRWEIKNIGGFNIINDSYNANPESVKAAVKTFLQSSGSPKVIVLGDMGELGEYEEDYHKEIGKYLNDFSFDFLVTVGDLAGLIKPENQKNYKNFTDNKSAAEYIRSNIEKGANILLKASRSMKFEEIIEELNK